MDVGLLGDSIALAQAKTQSNFGTAVRRLSTGLRVQSAADDPSGLAIAESLKAQAAGADRASANVQDAVNALTVAEGGLQTITDILQRMRQLVVEDHSDIVSTQDKANLQAEVDQLRAEIDRIAGNTTFNGKHLLDGSSSGDTPAQAKAVLETNDALSGGGTVLDTTLDNVQPQPSVNPSQYPVYVTFTIAAYDQAANQLELDVTLDSQDPNFGPRQTSVYSSASGDGIAPGTDYPVGFSPPSPGNPTFTEFDQSFNPIVSYNIGTLSVNDVGKSASLIIVPQQSKADGSNLQIHDGANEGNTIGIDIQAVTSQDLNVNSIVLGDNTTDDANEYKIDYALTQITAERARIGAQIVALKEDQTADNVAAVNVTASQSNIQDANIAQEVSGYVRDQLLVRVQTSLLANTKPQAESVLGLFR